MTGEARLRRPAKDVRRPFPTRAELESHLSQSILTGVHRPGDKLPSERELAVRSGLSRPVVREVLRSLVERGLLDVVPARGAFVREPDSMHLAGMMGSLARQQRATPRDLIEARVTIEERSTRNAARLATPDDVARLHELVRAFDKAPTVLDQVRCDLAFHGLVAQLSGNPVIETMFGAIAPMVLEMQLRSLHDPVVRDEGAPLHGVIARAIETGDADAAAAAMLRHVTLAYDLYGGDLDVPLGVLAEGRLTAILGERANLAGIIADVLLSVRDV